MKQLLVYFIQTEDRRRIRRRRASTHDFVPDPESKSKREAVIPFSLCCYVSRRCGMRVFVDGGEQHETRTRRGHDRCSCRTRRHIISHPNQLSVCFDFLPKQGLLFLLHSKTKATQIQSPEGLEPMVTRGDDCVILLHLEDGDNHEEEKSE